VSDFETLLERLLLDPAFKAAFAADPERALIGYALTDDERGLLMAEFSTEAGQSSRMEERTSKAALFGLLGAAAEMFGAAGGGVPQVNPGASALPDGEKLSDAGIKPGFDGISEGHARQNGEISYADFDHESRSELAFYKGLVTEMDVPETDAASKDAPEFPPGEDGPFDTKTPSLPPYGDKPVEIKMVPSEMTLAPDEVKPPPAPDPGEFKLTPESVPEKPIGIKLAPDLGFKAPSSFDPPAPIEPELPKK
jgi:hypothetical protein